MLRLQVITTGEFFVMGDGALTIDIQSSLFNKQDDFLGSKSFPGKLPLEPNRRYLGNRHYINSSNAGRSLQVMMWLGFLPYKEVKMVYTIENDLINYTLYIDAGIIARQLKTLKMIELDVAGYSEQINFSGPDEFRAYMNTTVTAAPGTMPVVFFPFKNTAAYKVIPADQYSAYPDIAFPVNSYMNAWQIDPLTGNGTFMVEAVGADKSETQVAFFYLVHIIKGLLKFLGYEPIGSWLTDPDAIRIVVFNNIATQRYYLHDFWLDMPDILASDFIKELRSAFGLLIDFDQTNKRCIIESIDALKASAAKDFRKRQLKNTYRETGTAANAFTITRPAEDLDKAFTDEEKALLPVLSIGDTAGALDVQDISLISVDTKMITELSPANADATTWRIPNIEMPIYPEIPLNQISDFKTPDRNKFKLRFLYYHGMKPNGVGNLYPYASSDNLDKDGHVLTNFTLALNTTGTTYSLLQRYYRLIMNAKPFEQSVLLNRQEMLELKASDKILIQDFDHSTVECLLDVAGADLGRGELIEVKLTLYPIIIPDNELQILPDPSVPVLPPPPPFDNGVVYVKMTFSNFQNIDHPYPPPRYQTINFDVIVNFYEDAAMVTPKDVTDLAVHWKVISPFTGPYIATTICTSTGHQVILAANAQQSTNQGGTLLVWNYNLEPGILYHII